MISDIFKKRTTVRYALLAVIIAAFSVLQNADGCFPRPFGAHAVLLIPAVCCAAMYERETAGIFFGLFAGLLWDTAAKGNNFYALFLVTAGYICGLLVSTVLRNNIVTATGLSIIFELFYFVGYWFFHYVINGYGMSVYILLHYYLPSFVYSIILVPFVFLLIRAVENAFAEE